MKIYIEPVGDDKFTVLIDGVPSGEYTTVKKAKAGARRFFPPNHHVKWETRIDGKLFGIQRHWTRKPCESF